jgi:hypothetical protein
MDKATEALVRTRAAGRCEYCRSVEGVSKLKFTIDHAIARQHGGSDDLGNLALACGFCNLHKGPNIAGIDPETGSLTRLFHPRRDTWSEHFRWEGAVIVPLTAVARTTVAVLAMNHPEQITVRQALMDEGAFD